MADGGDLEGRSDDCIGATPQLFDYFRSRALPIFRAFPLQLALPDRKRGVRQITGAEFKQCSLLAAGPRVENQNFHDEQLRVSPEHKFQRRNVPRFLLFLRGPSCPLWLRFFVSAGTESNKR